MWMEVVRVLETIKADVKAIFEKDPAAKGLIEVLLCYSGLHALIAHRINHFLYKLGIPVLPRLFSQVVGRGEIPQLTLKIRPGLDLIPANSDLFKPVFFFHLQNFLYNLELCRTYYTYIVPIFPVLMIIFAKWDIIPTFILSIVLALLMWWIFFHRQAIMMRDRVTAVENKETARAERMKEEALWRVATNFGFVFDVQDFMADLGAQGAGTAGPVVS